MNRIPTIAAAIALIALLIAGYLALNSRISRLEEALESSSGTDLSSRATDPSGEFGALGYDGTSRLRLRFSNDLATPDGVEAAQE